MRPIVDQLQNIYEHGCDHRAVAISWPSALARTGIEYCVLLIVVFAASDSKLSAAALMLDWKSRQVFLASRNFSSHRRIECLL